MELQISEIDDAKQLVRTLHDVDDGTDWCRLTEALQNDARRILEQWMRTLRERSGVAIKSYLNSNEDWRVKILCERIEDFEALDSVDPSLRGELKLLRECLEELMTARGQLSTLEIRSFGISYFGKVNAARKALDKAAVIPYFDQTRYYEDTKSSYDKVTGIFNHPIIRSLQLLAWAVVVLFVVAALVLYVLSPMTQDSFQARGDGGISGLRLYYKVPGFVAPNQSDTIHFGIVDTSGERRRFRVELSGLPPLQPETGQQVVYLIEVDDAETRWLEYHFTLGPVARNTKELKLQFLVVEEMDSSSQQQAQTSSTFESVHPIEIRQWTVQQYRDWVDVRALFSAIFAGAFLAITKLVQWFLYGKAK